MKFLKQVRVRLRMAPAVVACATALLFPSVTSAAGDPVGKVVAIQNDVQTRTADSEAWKPSVLHQELYGLDRIRTGPGSRAAILYSDQTLQRINEKSEVQVLAPDGNKPGVLRVISGTHYFSSRKPKDYGRIVTPTVTAAIRGTEFVVEVAPDGTTTITMLEGVVEASNEYGEVTVTAGEQAHVEPGTAPVKRIVLRPRDAVAWSLYYPPVLGLTDQARLERMGSAGQDLARAAELLASGQVSQARPLIENVRKSNPDHPIALALASVVELVADSKDEAMRLAEQAVAADSDSPAAALALSFAAQAAFDLEKAGKLAETAARLDPHGAEAQARVAELRMARGDIKGAKKAAQKATARDARSVRALTVLGFVELAELRSARAVHTFERAVAADAGFPMAHLGLGIATIRRGDLAGGREKMQTAAMLDPDNSLMRSYLAKAYYEERRKPEASKELAAAKQLDPSDPTPHLYDAILKRSYNRPVEALEELRKSVELNDRRAVYRSRLLLDQDLAMRSADLAGIYSELGFDELGMVTARRSADADHANYSSHLFLAGSYRNLPGFAPAFLSEVLQARIYQPVNVNAVRPDIVNETVSFNEYGSLIDQPRVRVFAGGSYGETDTGLGEVVESDALRELLELDDSDSLAADVTVALNRDRFAGAVSFSTVDSEGFRINNDVDNDVARAFFAFAPTYRDQFQVNIIDGTRKTGDLPLREIPLLLNMERLETDLTNIGVGYHRMLSPAADLAISAIYSDIELTGTNDLFGLTATAELDGLQLEAQYVHRQKRLTWIAGAGHFDGEQELTTDNGFTPRVEFKADSTFSNAYLYLKIRDLGPVELTAALSYEDVTAPVGLLLPRDSAIGAGEVEFDEEKLSFKIGLTERLTARTVLRAAAFTRLSPSVGRLQTLEPTQVAGFNQFFNDTGGTWSKNYGVGIDREFTRRLFGGLSVLRRDLDIPDPDCGNPNLPSGCQGQQVTGVVERESEEWLASAYLNGTLGKRWALSIQYAYEERDFDFFQVDNATRFEDFMRTWRVRPEARLFFPWGLFASVRTTRLDQRIDRFPSMQSSERNPEDTDFWISDLQVGYRFPERWGSVVLTASNISNKKFAFFRSSLEEDIVPARTVRLSVRLTY